MTDESEDEWVNTDRDAPQDADEWGACTNPDYLTGRLIASSSERIEHIRRKWLLFSAGCVRLVWSSLTDRHSRKVVEAAEAYADGFLPEAEFEAARERAELVRQRMLHGGEPDSFSAEYDAAVAAARLRGDFEVPASQTGPGWAYCRAMSAMHVADRHADADEERLSWVRANRTVADLFRCVMGNPYRPVPFAPEWRTSTAVLLAQRVYDSGDFSAMPILADALQDAGCEELAVLTHCRAAGPHCRGCWVVDLVLGREAPPVFPER